MQSLSRSLAHARFGRTHRALALAALAVCGFGAAYSQVAMPTAPGFGENAAGGRMPCPHPYVVTIQKNAGATTAHLPDLPPGARPNEMTYNDGRVNRFFTDTISWKPPGRELCCEYAAATVSWTIQNKATNNLQKTDTTGLYLNGQAVAHYSLTNMAPNATMTYTYNLTPAQIQGGRITLVTQDDTAVTNFSVRIQACCVKPSH